MALNARKRAFADALAEGKSQRQAALAAGYVSNADALDKTGYRLVRDPDVIAYLERTHGLTTRDAAQADPPKTVPAVKPPKVTAEPAPRHDGEGWIEDPLEYLKRVMNDPLEDPKLRADAAKALMPFIHQRQGEAGKKEQKQAAAEQAGTGRFGLRVVQ